MSLHTQQVVGVLVLRSSNWNMFVGWSVMDCHGMMDGMAQCMQTAPWGLVCPHGKVSLEMLKDGVTHQKLRVAAKRCACVFMSKMFFHNFSHHFTAKFVSDGPLMSSTVNMIKQRGCLRQGRLVAYLQGRTCFNPAFSYWQEGTSAGNQRSLVSPFAEGVKHRDWPMLLTSRFSMLSSYPSN